MQCGKHHYIGSHIIIYVYQCSTHYIPLIYTMLHVKFFQLKKKMSLAPRAVPLKTSGA